MIFRSYSVCPCDVTPQICTAYSMILPLTKKKPHRHYPILHDVNLWNTSKFILYPEQNVALMTIILIVYYKHSIKFQWKHWRIQMYSVTRGPKGHISCTWVQCATFLRNRLRRPFLFLKNTNLVEDVEILLPVKFRWILFSGFREEVENVSANQRPGRPSCFSDRHTKHKLGRGC